MSERTARVFFWVSAAGDEQGVSLAALCRAALRLGVDGASVTAMTGPSVHEPVAASDALAARIEELQFTLGEGPASAAFAFGSPMLVPDLEVLSTRWPGFVPAALDRGVAAVFAFPLHSGAVRLGVLELYRRTAGPLPPGVLADALVLVDLALTLLLDSSHGLTDHPGYRPVDGIGHQRDVVHQATGMIAEQLGVDMVEALVRLRARAFTETASLSEMAGEVVAQRLRFRPDPEPEPDAGGPP